MCIKLFPKELKFHCMEETEFRAHKVAAICKARCLREEVSEIFLNLPFPFSAKSQVACRQDNIAQGLAENT